MGWMGKHGNYGLGRNEFSILESPEAAREYFLTKRTQRRNWLNMSSSDVAVPVDLFGYAAGASFELEKFNLWLELLNFATGNVLSFLHDLQRPGLQRIQKSPKFSQFIRLHVFAP